MDAESLIRFLIENDDEDELSTKEFMKQHSLQLATPYAVLLKWMGTGELNVGASIDRTGHRYVHENTISASVNSEWYPNDATSEQFPDEEEEVINPLLARLEEELTEEARDLSRDIYKALEQEHDYMTSEEQVIESLDANENYFTEDGDDFDDSGEEMGVKLNELPGDVQLAVIQRLYPDLFEQPEETIERVSAQEIYFDSEGNQVEKTWFLASELEPRAKSAVHQKHYDYNVHEDWWDFVYEQWKEKLAKLGYYGTIDISFSGFASQGDGASFTCKSIDLQKWITRRGSPHLKDDEDGS